MEKGRKEAIIKGLTKYKSSRECKKHGKVERYSTGGACIICQKEASSKRAEEAGRAIKYLRYLDNGGAKGEVKNGI